MNKVIIDTSGKLKLVKLNIKDTLNGFTVSLLSTIASTAA